MTDDAARHISREGGGIHARCATRRSWHRLVAHRPEIGPFADAQHVCSSIGVAAGALEALSHLAAIEGPAGLRMGEDNVVVRAECRAA
jgi:hypothetical protein